MKKFISISLFVVMVASLFILVVVQNQHRQDKRDQFNQNCETMDSKSFASERVHGVILREGTVLSVRLEGEKNFSPPGGHIEVNETPEQALVRELKEELAIQTGTEDFKPYKTYCEVLGATQTQRTKAFFVNKWDGPLQVRRNDQLKWVTTEFLTDSSADTELVKLLQLLQTDKLLK